MALGHSPPNHGSLECLSGNKFSLSLTASVKIGHSELFPLRQKCWEVKSCFCLRPSYILAFLLTL